MKVLVVGQPNPYQQAALDVLIAEGAEVVIQSEAAPLCGREHIVAAIDECAAMGIGHIETVHYVHAGDYPTVPKKERGYPTLRQHVRGHR